jgi:LytR cell envelope-related transcriptional attenuator
MSMLTPPGMGGRRKVRRRGHYRHRGRTIVVLLVVATAIAAGVAAWLQHDDPQTTVVAPQRPSCPPTQSAPTVVAAHDVRVNVYNATKRHGLASQVAQQLRQRGFVVGKVGNVPGGRTVAGIAEIRASASGTAAARTVGAQVASFVAIPDQRKDASVDLVLGVGFRSLRTTAAAAAAISPTPAPRPSGC